MLYGSEDALLHLPLIYLLPAYSLSQTFTETAKCAVSKPKLTYPFPSPNSPATRILGITSNLPFWDQFGASPVKICPVSVSYSWQHLWDQVAKPGEVLGALLQGPKRHQLMIDGEIRPSLPAAAWQDAFNAHIYALMQAFIYFIDEEEKSSSS